MTTQEREIYIHRLCYSVGSDALRPLVTMVLELEDKVEGLTVMVATLSAAIASDRQQPRNAVTPEPR